MWPLYVHQDISSTRMALCQHLARNASENKIVRLFFAGCIFIQSEGVGFTIYFTVSAIMDNYTIFFVNSTEFCQYVKAVALYSLALVAPRPMGRSYLGRSTHLRGGWMLRTHQRMMANSCMRRTVTSLMPYLSCPQLSKYSSQERRA